MLDLWRGLVLLGAGLAFWPYLGSHEPKWAFVMLGGATGFLLWRRLTWPDVLGLCIIVWSAFSLLWSSDWREGVTTMIAVVGLFGVFLLFEQGKPFKLIGQTAAVAVVGAVVLGFEFPEIFGGYFNQNWITEFLVIVGVLAAVKGGLLGCGAAATAAIFVIFYNGSFAWGAAAASLAVMGLIALRWYWMAAIAFLGKINAVIFLLPFMGKDIADSFHARFELWFNSIVLWTGAPIFGGGLGSYNHDYSAVAEAHVSSLGAPRFQNVFMYPGSAHNDALSLMVELGVVGFLLAGGFCWSVLKLRTDAMQAMRWPLAAAAGICMIAFPLLLPSSAVFIAAMIGFAAHPGASSRSVSLAGLWRLCGGLLERRLLSTTLGS